ncbi:MAG: glycosyltransferase [Nitrospirota bacterium]
MRLCKGSCATAYVTKEALQRRYPSPPDAFCTSFSDVELGDEAFALIPRNGIPAGRPIRLVMVGSLAQLYKAPDVLIDAVAICIGQGLDLQLVLVGDGKYRPYLEAKAARLGLGERVRLAGELASGKGVREELDKADLFLLPSRTEGLPRAMIEAMARALPCIGSNVGGIPELLSEDDLVPPGHGVTLAEKIMEVVRDPRRLATMSRRNLTHSRQYHETLMRKSRIQFYEYVRAKTEEWLISHRA